MVALQIGASVTGSSKFDVTPGGGGMAEIVSHADVLSNCISILYLERKQALWQGVKYLRGEIRVIYNSPRRNLGKLNP